MPSSSVWTCLELGFNVFTGQTGAGKSIILDSLLLLCGARSDRDLIRTGEQKAVVEGVFEIGEAALPVLAEYGVEPEDGELFLTRTLTADGKSGARVNALPVPLSVLRAIAAKLVTVHGQQDTQSIRSEQEQLSMLDGYAGNETVRAEYDAARAEYIQKKQRYEALCESEKDNAARAEILAFQSAELTAANVKKGEEDALLEERSRLVNTEKIALLANAAYDALTGSDAADELSASAADALEKLSAYIPAAAALAERVKSAMFELEDVAESLRDYREAEEPGARLDKLEQRLSDIQGLRKKYRTDADGLSDLLDEINTSLSQARAFRRAPRRSRAGAAGGAGRTAKAADALTKTRVKAAAAFEKAVGSALAELDMPKVVFRISLTPSEPGPSGADKVEFLISANAGEAPRPLGKIASGGELSRIMLAMKSVFGGGESTSVFDEIDAGISGSTSYKVGRKLHALSAGTGAQLLCVTHSAQLAAQADTHYLIEKQVEGSRTETRVTLLDNAGRENEFCPHPRRRICHRGRAPRRKEPAHESLNGNRTGFCSKSHLYSLRLLRNGIVKGNSPQPRLRSDFFQQSAKWNGMLFGRTGLRCMEQPGRTSMQRIPETIRSNSWRKRSDAPAVRDAPDLFELRLREIRSAFCFSTARGTAHRKQPPQPVAQFGKQRRRVMNMAFRNPSETLYPKNPLTNCSVLLPNGKDRLFQ